MIIRRHPQALSLQTAPRNNHFLHSALSIDVFMKFLLPNQLTVMCLSEVSARTVFVLTCDAKG